MVYVSRYYGTGCELNRWYEEDGSNFVDRLFDDRSRLPKNAFFSEGVGISGRKVK